MSIADELFRLEQMRERGNLSEEEFKRAKARLLDSGIAQPEPVFQSINGFRRSSSDRWVAGLCGGLARSTGVASWIWRLLFVLMLLAGCTGLVIYLVLWLVVPLQMDAPMAHSS